MLTVIFALFAVFTYYIFTITLHIHYNSVENLHWQKLAETCFCRTGLDLETMVTDCLHTISCN